MQVFNNGTFAVSVHYDDPFMSNGILLDTRVRYQIKIYIYFFLLAKGNAVIAIMILSYQNGVYTSRLSIVYLVLTSPRLETAGDGIVLWITFSDLNCSRRGLIEGKHCFIALI